MEVNNKNHFIKLLAEAIERDEDLINFEKKIINFLDKDSSFEIEYSAEPKIDGISASLTYLNGKLKYGLSRGDGREGEDITLKYNWYNPVTDND